MHAILSSLYFLCGFSFTVSAIISACLSNMHTGILLSLGIGLVLIVFGILYGCRPQCVPRVLCRIVPICLCIGILLIASLFLYGKTDTANGDEDVLLILGAGIHGETVSKTLAARLDRAISYYEENQDVLIVVSGGQGPQEAITEALAMARYLIAAGIPADQILQETSATSTNENFSYTASLLHTHFPNGYHMCFVTTDFHVFRAAALAHENAIDGATHLHAEMPWYALIPNGIREWLAIGKYLCFKK